MSFLVPVEEDCAESIGGQRISINWEDGKKVMNSAHANYSYGSLQKVFEIAVKRFPPHPSCSSALILGYGGGSLVEVLKGRFRGSITAVENDPAVLMLARKHFKQNLREVGLREGDAIRFVKETLARYDLIFVDLFTDTEPLPAAFEALFIQRLFNLLNSRGRVYHNLMISSEKKLDQIMADYRRIFPGVELLKPLGSNQVIIADKKDK